MPIQQRPRDRRITAEDTLHALNDEVVPILRRVREAVNRVLVQRTLLADASVLAVDWALANHQHHALDASVTTVTFADPPDPGFYCLLVTQGGGFTLGGWPSSVKWFGGSAPTITATAARADLIEFYFDGTSYYGSALQDAS